MLFLCHYCDFLFVLMVCVQHSYPFWSVLFFYCTKCGVCHSFIYIFTYIHIDCTLSTRIWNVSNTII